MVVKAPTIIDACVMLQLCGLVQRCWEANPAERPTMVEVRDELHQLYEKARRRPS